MLWPIVWIVAAVAIVFAFLVGKSPLRRVIVLSRAAQRAFDRKDWTAAARLCRECHVAAGQLKEPRKSLVEAQIKLPWAAVLYRQGRMAEAEELFRGGFSRARAVGCHPQASPFYLVWGDLCADEGRHPEAEQHYRMALQVHEQTGNLGLMIFDSQRLGDSLIRQGRRDEAEEVINRAIVLETQVVHQQMTREGKNPGEHRVISWSLPDLHFCREQYEEARQLYREKVEFWERSVTRPDNIDLGHLQTRLALSEARTGHRAEAIEMYTRAEKTIEREWSEGHPRAVAVRAAKAAMLQEAVEVQEVVEVQETRA